MVFRAYLCEKKSYLTVIVVKRGRSQNMCPIQPLLYEIYMYRENTTFRTKFRFKNGLMKGSVPLRPGEKIRKFKSQNVIHCSVSMCPSMY